MSGTAGTRAAPKHGERRVGKRAVPLMASCICMCSCACMRACAQVCRQSYRVSGHHLSAGIAHAIAGGRRYVVRGARAHRRRRRCAETTAMSADGIRSKLSAESIRVVAAEWGTQKAQRTLQEVSRRGHLLRCCRVPRMSSCVVMPADPIVITAPARSLCLLFLPASFFEAALSSWRMSRSALLQNWLAPPSRP